MSLLLSLLLSAGPAHSAGPAVALDRHPELVAAAIELPPSAPPAPDSVPITAPWRLVYTAAGVRTWEVALPLRPRTLFFHRAPGDMKVHQGDRPLRIASGTSGLVRADSWAYSSHALQVRRPIAAGPPRPGEYTVSYSSATKLEDGLRNDDGDDPVSFVFRSLQLDDTTRSGLLLPAPGSITFDVAVPPGGAVLDLTPALLPPELADPAEQSDGARLALYINDERIVSWRMPSPGLLERKRVSLSPWSDEQISLSLRSEPGPSGETSLDHVFIADPVVFVPEPDPARVVVIFVDTLRADHLSVYGYPRETTPKLERWSEQAAIFEQARSIAPWTLPSTQTMLTGDYPEQWSSADTIQGALSSAGWATTFIAGNIYLSSNFGMARDWGSHRCINWPVAQVQVDRALSHLNDHSDRPVFMMLHFMDMHLPYTEPPWYRYTFAGAAPEMLPDYQFDRSDVVTAGRKMGAEGRQYVRDRYDNNLRYIDDQLARLLRQLDDNDTVIVLADHGEEFWDHGGFEHGHTLHDELLRVPMIARGPGFPAGRFPEPVSLLDVAPSIAEAAGVSLDSAIGLQLQDLADGSASEEFATRPQAFGRPLYGARRWGSLSAGMKYTSGAGQEDVYDLTVDPGEQDDLAPEGLAAGRAALGAAMGTEAPVLFRLTAARKSSETADLHGILTVPGGIERVWIGEDYLGRSAARFERLSDDTVEITWEGRQKATREVYVLPSLPAEEAIAEARLVMRIGEREVAAEPSTNTWPPPFRARNPTLLQARSGARKVSLAYGVAPVPPEQAPPTDLDECERLSLLIEELRPFAERCPELVALGYMDEEGCADKEAELAALQQSLRSCR